jgi:RNA polymerase sigma-70 factor, ECF subfamily
MESAGSPDITQMLAAWRDGDPEALARLTPHVYAELHRVARVHLAGERAGHILQPSALVNEAFVRLMEWQPDKWANREQFFGISAILMRRILVEAARERGAAKRGGQALHVSLSEADNFRIEKDTELVALDEALIKLEGLDPRQAQIVVLRFFGGMSLEETAEVMQLSVSTVRRDFRVARAWLRVQLTAMP